mgnify:CR=1 FL=1
MVNRLYNKQVSPKGYKVGGRVAKMGGGMMMKRSMMNKGGRVGLQEGGSPGYKQGKMDVLFNRYEKNNQKIKELKKKLKSLKRVRKSIGKK